MRESLAAPTDLDLISFLKAIPDARMRRGVRIPGWYLLLVTVQGVLSGCESLRDLVRFARRHQAASQQVVYLRMSSNGFPLRSKTRN